MLFRLFAAVAAVVAWSVAAGAQTPPLVPDAVRAHAARDGVVRVIVELKGPAETRASVLTALPAGAHRVVRRYRTVPYVALEVSPAALDALERMRGSVARVMPDELMHAVLADSAPLVEADQAWSVGYDGSGTTIAVLDSGVESTHPALSGKVVAEACFSSTVFGQSESVCPSGAEEEIGTGAAEPCSLADCRHGTHVAGIASGVATGATVIAVQVFSKITQPLSCGGFAPCMGAYTSDIIAGLEFVYSLAASRNIAAVNMSLGGSTYTAPCDGQPYKPVIDNLRARGIATVIASGNNGTTDSISSPACISTAVSVGATTKTDGVAWFSNVASFLSLFAPGEAITSAVPGGGYASMSGTSMAAPHVAGAWSILREASPGTNVSGILSTLRSTGLPTTDTRLTGTATVPRIRILRALATLVPVTNPAPAIASISPTHARVGTAVPLTVTGSDFNAFSVVRWNGAMRPTTVLSTARAVAQIPATDLDSIGTALVDVYTPTPGGGTSGAVTFTIDPPPSLSVSASSVAPGSTITATLANGFGGTLDWIGLFAAGAADNTYLKSTYVGTNVTDRTWSTTAPSTNGTYEFRLIVNNVRVATSPSFTVDSSLNPVPVVSSVSPRIVAAGGTAFTLTVTGSNFIAASTVRWNGSPRATTFVSATQVRAEIASADIASLGMAQISVFSPAPGGGESAGLPVSINPPPSLTVSTTTAAPGQSVTVTLTNGFGGSQDWLSLALTTAPGYGYVQYVYVGAGVTSRTWMVNMPATPGTYEFRYFPNGGYTAAAKSPQIVVAAPSTPPADPPALAVNASSVGAFENITVTLTNGTGGSGDWLAFAASSAPNSSYLQYIYVGAGVTTKTWTVTAPATAGSYEFRLFANNSLTRLATSPTVTVTAPTTTPSLIVSATEVAPGGSVTMTLIDGYGGSKDWLALAAVGASPYSYVQYTYVGTGIRTRTWTVAMPTTPGSYEFRLFLNNSYTIAARSPAVVVR